MAVIQKALEPLADLDIQPMKVAPHISISTQSAGDGYKESAPVVDKEEEITQVPTSVKLKVEQVTAPYVLPSQKTNSNIDYSYIEGLNSLDLDWSNPAHRNRLLEMQRGAEWNGKGSGISTKGAAGPAQFMKATWDELKKKGVIPRHASRFDKKYSTIAQEYYMNSLYNSDSVKSATTEVDRIKRTLAAYNAGIGNVAKAIEKATKQGNSSMWYKYLPMPEETIPYLSRILKSYREKQPLLVTRKLGGVLFKQ